MSLNSYAQHPNVTITGKTYNDFTAGVSIHSNLAKLGRSIYYPLSLNPDSTFEMKFYLAEPTEIQFNNMEVLGQPGDSIQVIVRKTGLSPTMEFSGHGSSLYNFMNSLRQFKIEIYPPSFSKSVASGEIQIPRALEITERGYKQEMKLFEEFAKKYSPSDEVSAYLYSKIYFSYLGLLRSVIEESGPKADSLAAKYFGSLNPSVLGNELYRHSRGYLNFMSYMLEDYWAAPKKNETAAETMKRQFDFVKNEFSGKIRDALSSRLFVSHVTKDDLSYASEKGNLIVANALRPGDDKLPDILDGLLEN